MLRMLQPAAPTVAGDAITDLEIAGWMLEVGGPLFLPAPSCVADPRIASGDVVFLSDLRVRRSQ